MYLRKRSGMEKLLMKSPSFHFEESLYDFITDASNAVIYSQTYTRVFVLHEAKFIAFCAIQFSVNYYILLYFKLNQAILIYSAEKTVRFFLHFVILASLSQNFHVIAQFCGFAYTKYIVYFINKLNEKYAKAIK